MLGLKGARRILAGGPATLRQKNHHPRLRLGL